MGTGIISHLHPKRPIEDGISDRFDLIARPQISDRAGQLQNTVVGASGRQCGPQR